MKDKIINAWAVISITAILIGLLIAIWFGGIGLKIAASGGVTLAADWLLFIWLQFTDQQKGAQSDKVQKPKQKRM